MLRFASSPTGDMNISNLRVAIFNHIMSKQLNQKLIVRIEDTDKDKNIDGKDKEILELLSLFAIDYEYVIHQSDNFKTHQKMAMKLLMDKKAFSCFCSDDWLNKQKKQAKIDNKPFRYDGHCENLSDDVILNTEAPFTIRIKKPLDNTKFTDSLKGDFDYKAFDVDSFVILHQDKTPTHNYACAVDDMVYDISTVIRDEDYLSNTPKQIHIRKALGYEKEINYIHLPLILNAKTGENINKSDDISSIKSLIDEGILPAAIVNYLVLLGNKVPQEIFTLEDAIEWFDIKKVSRSAVKFDMDKLRFINREHLMSIDEMRLSKILGFADTDIGVLAKLYLEESSTIKELKTKIDLIFSKKDPLKGFEKEYKKLKSCLESAPFYDDFNELEKYITKEIGLKDTSLSKPLRYILTGTEDGPNLSDIYPLIKNYLGEIV
ncbi:MAG: glutamate--tRNA ligase [Campylobacteraceae bacterium]|nr:glutamate--tRNA ligase [Campylobacteraceae bacterium]